MAKARRGRGGRFVKATRKHRRRRHVAKAAAPARRRRRRSSAGKRRPAVGYIVGSKRIRRRKMNPRRRHARRHSNPRFNIAGITSQLQPAFWGATGGIGLDILHGYVNPMLPAMFQTGYGKHGAKIAGALAIGWGARKFLGARGNQVAAGALTLAVYGLLKDVLVQFAPGIKGLGDYEEVVINSTAGDLGAYLPGTRLGAYLPDGSVASPGMGAYLSGDTTEEGAALMGMDF